MSKPLTNPVLSPRLSAIVRTGITDRGEFTAIGLSKPQLGKVTFAKPPRIFPRTGFLKSLSNSAKSRAKKVDHLTEKAVNLRDQLFAAMCQNGGQTRTVKSLAKKIHSLSKQGVNLNEINWGMGRTRLEKEGDDSVFAVRHGRLEKSFKENLFTALNPSAKKDFSPSADPYNSLGKDVVGVLNRFASAWDVPPWTTDRSNGNSSVLSLQGTRTHQDADINGLQRRLEVAMQEHRTLIDECRLLRMERDPASMARYQEAWQLVMGLNKEISRLQASIQDLSPHASDAPKPAAIP